ncbi:hypothetical protein FSP39_007737 [Pinctada imbricata]|uniref:Ribosomal protein L27 n=1 Tax=Pinctada imbricata TaxID=66713 RepID=A0AA89BT02_PINIB|nr:hypothetical protein FSP39_007737 [Pinctada imbricata]
MKRSDGQFAHQYEILVTQHGLRYYPGENVGIDRRNRLYALCDGEMMVSCETLSPYPDSPLYRHMKRGYVVKKKFVNLIPAPLHGKFKLVSEV